jgi:hypothetical protein
VVLWNTRYLFTVTAGGSGQGLRPFRDTDAPEDGDQEAWHRNA